MSNRELKPCPYNQAVKCIMDEGCYGCETFSKYMANDTNEPDGRDMRKYTRPSEDNVKNAIDEVLRENQSLKEEIKKYKFMIDNGLGPEDIVNDITPYPID